MTFFILFSVNYNIIDFHYKNYNLKILFTLFFIYRIPSFYL